MGSSVEDKIFNLILDKLVHATMVHGAGFCGRCGELRKRCKCKKFKTVKMNCHCYDKTKSSAERN